MNQKEDSKTSSEQNKEGSKNIYKEQKSQSNSSNAHSHKETEKLQNYENCQNGWKASGNVKQM
jgi:hypothetical protein